MNKKLHEKGSRNDYWMVRNIANVWNNVWYFIEVNKTEGYIRHVKLALDHIYICHNDKILQMKVSTIGPVMKLASNGKVYVFAIFLRYLDRLAQFSSRLV